MYGEMMKKAYSRNNMNADEGLVSVSDLQRRNMNADQGFESVSDLQSRKMYVTGPVQMMTTLRCAE